MAAVLGVDGSPDGWVAIRMEERRVTGAASYATFSALLSAEADAAVIAVDMPIGLPVVAAWPRGADAGARAFIGRMRSSVFVVPPVEALQAATYPEAVQRCRDAGLPGLSQQAYALRHKIFEVAAHISDRRVHEVHPEVSFAAMNERHLQYGKRTWNGHHERHGILRRAGIEVPEDLGVLGRAGVDDVLDGIAAGWSASRIAAGTAMHLPADASAGSPRIWY